MGVRVPVLVLPVSPLSSDPSVELAPLIKPQDRRSPLGARGTISSLYISFMDRELPLSSSPPGLWECGKRGVCGVFSKPLWESRPQGAISKVLWKPCGKAPESSRAAFQAKRQGFHKTGRGGISIGRPAFDCVE